MYCYQMQACSWLSSGLEAGTSDDFVQFLDVGWSSRAFSCDRVEVPGRCGTRAMQIIVLAATIVIIATRGQLGRAKAATAAGSG